MIPLRYLSLCSGIEAATTAWHSLGWDPVAFCEIDAFPSAVLAYHWPHIPNLKDMTKWRTWSDDMLAQVDILVGGTPCQAFSVAGLRNSLDDERGNLTLIYAHILDHIDTVRASRGLPPCICLWENVPGVLSTKDNAFGCFLAGLAGEDDALVAPRGKWTNAGYVSGPQRAVAWRTLDAQYFGVAQRRRRVFLVASAGDGFRPEQVLFEREGVRRDSPPSREAGQEITPTLRAGAANGSPGHGQRSGDSRDELIVPCFSSVPTAAIIGCLNSSGGHASPLTTSADRSRSAPIVAFGVDIQNQASTGDISGTLLGEAMKKGGQSGMGVAVAFAQNTRDEVREMAVVGALAAEPGMKQTSYIRQAMQVRRLTPVECARLQGFPDGHTKIEWRGRLEEDCPDGPQYKAYGNSMAVPCMAWLGRRIAEFGFPDCDRGLYDEE